MLTRLSSVGYSELKKNVASFHITYAENNSVFAHNLIRGTFAFILHCLRFSCQV